VRKVTKADSTGGATSQPPRGDKLAPSRGEGRHKAESGGVTTSQPPKVG
jgi:hypothetical protein